MLELLAVKYGLQSFASIIKNRHILVRCDNSTAVSYISNMGGTHSRLRNAIAKEIWLWTMTQGVWITITHIPGKLNKEADFGSRIFFFFLLIMFTRIHYITITEYFHYKTYNLHAILHRLTLY